jgi:hypothetical protein
MNIRSEENISSKQREVGRGRGKVAENATSQEKENTAEG